MKKPKIVYIEWVDSCSGEEGWEWIDAMPAEYCAANIVTCGMLLSKSKRFIRVAHSMGHANSGRRQAIGVIDIPRVAIQKMKYLAG